MTVQGAPAPVAADNTFQGKVTVAEGTRQVDVTATDPSGNVRTSTYEVTQGTGTSATYTYDANGNLATKVEGGSTWAYEWNARNQLVRVTKDSVEVAAFAYDPLGRRVKKVAGSVTTLYTYADNDILREATSTGATYTYVHGPGTDEPLPRDNAGTLTCYQRDGIGSIVRETDDSGTVLLTRRYDAYGRMDAGEAQSGYAFTGREWDSETSLYYYRARYYDPDSSRFLGQDPSRSWRQPGLYTYVHNDPVNRIDPSGMVMTSWRTKLYYEDDLDVVGICVDENDVRRDTNAGACNRVDYKVNWDCQQAPCGQWTASVTPTFDGPIYISSGEFPYKGRPPGDRNVVDRESALDHEYLHISDQVNAILPLFQAVEAGRYNSKSDCDEAVFDAAKRAAPIWKHSGRESQTRHQ